ncbi:MAG: efflux RND transporter periplasmic adaptor subunit, partial [Burkholderiaceae bacterium]
MRKAYQSGIGAVGIVLVIVLLGAIAGGGWWLYQLGMKQGMSHSGHSMAGHSMAGHMTHSDTQMPAAGAPPANAESDSATPMAKGTVDPAGWGIPEGEDATRRHMATGLKAGDVDPETGLEILYYHDPMVPGKNFDAPSKSPFMDMMLVPEYAGAGGADAGTISVSSRIQQNLGVRTGAVVERELSQNISAVGAIAWNERGKFTVQARATGFIVKLYVRATLDRVRRGQPLFDIYVPAWVAAQEDYLSLQRMQGRGLEGLIAAARQRMRQAGMTEAQIERVEEQQAVQARTTIVSPTSGVVTELMAREGSTVMPGMLLAKINRLSTVWAEAEVPESQASLLRPGSPVTAQTPALPGETFAGKVQALLPQVDPVTRTRRARVELSNKSR